MGVRQLLSICLIVLLLPALSYANSKLVELKNNPFSKPDIKIQKTLPVVKIGVSLPEIEPNINLEATMVSANGSMVIVNGTLIAIGEKIENMKLIEVREGEAIFRKGRKTRVYQVGVTERK
jgi:hypothetical protein